MIRTQIQVPKADYAQERFPADVGLATAFAAYTDPS